MLAQNVLRGIKSTEELPKHDQGNTPAFSGAMTLGLK